MKAIYLVYNNYNRIICVSVKQSFLPNNFHDNNKLVKHSSWSSLILIYFTEQFVFKNMKINKVNNTNWHCSCLPQEMVKIKEFYILNKIKICICGI